MYNDLGWKAIKGQFTASDITWLQESEIFIMDTNLKHFMLLDWLKFVIGRVTCALKSSHENHSVNKISGNFRPLKTVMPS